MAAMETCQFNALEACAAMTSASGATSEAIIPGVGAYASSPNALRLSSFSRSSPPGDFGSISNIFCQAA